MAALNEVLYDHIGRTYPRLNKYLEELSYLENQLKVKATDKNEIRNKISALKSGKENHPYIVKLREFKKAEDNFLKEKNERIGSLQSENSEDLSLIKDLEAAKLDENFYRKYETLDYDAKLKYENAKLKLFHLPRIIEYRESIRKEIADTRVERSKVTSLEVSKAREEVDKFKAEAKEEYKRSLDDLKRKRREQLISKKALSNEKEQLEKGLKSKIKVKEYEIPDVALNEKIKTLEYNYKEHTKLMEKIMNKDIADLRRKTPVETEKRFPIITYLTSLFPGLGQLFNGQPFKAVLFAIATLFIYGVAVPYAMGYGNYQGQGLRGLATLAKGQGRIHKSQIYMIEGVIALALMAIALTLLVVSIMDVRKVERGKIKGIREENTFETKTSLSENGFPYFVSFPALVFILFIVIVPLSTTILLSFANMDPNNQSKFTWVGLKNYISVIQGQGIAGKAFWNILGWTIVWTLVATSIAILVGFGLALLANNSRVKGKGFFRMVYLLPWAVPAFVTIMFFSLLMGPNGFISDLVNKVITFFGGAGDLRIKSNTNATRAALIFLQTWLGSSYVFLLSTGVLQAIPEELYEAAQIDGATAWQRMMKITIPLVTFQTAPLLVGQYTFNFNNFTIIYLFNKGGPFNTSKYGNLAGSSDLLISYIYKLTMESKYQSLAAAITLLISMALMFFAYLGFRNSKAFKEEKL